MALVVSMLVTMVWLAGRYEATQVQEKLERDTANAVGDVRAALSRNLQDLQALNAHSVDASTWRAHASEMLQQRRELMRIEWRGMDMRLQAHAETPYRTVPWEDEKHGTELHSAEMLTCTQARRFNGPSYSPSRFQLLGDGLGTETMLVCMPLTENGHVVGYVLGTYSLHGILVSHVGRRCRARRKSRSPSLTAPAGAGGRGLARLAHVHGPAAAGPARQHAGVAYGQLAPCAQRLSQCDDGAGHRHVDCLDLGVGGAGA